MMQLVCNGSRLDLYENTDLQFMEENPLFAFDNIKCERTTSFKLPATPTNDRVFSLARIPAYPGEGMRRKFPAQLQMGTIVKDGYLYVSSWIGEEYEAIFVTGEMIGLQALKNAGNISEYYDTNTRLFWTRENIKDANTTQGQATYAITRYSCSNSEMLHPSVDLADIIDGAYWWLTTRHLTELKRGWRLIPREVHGVSDGVLTLIYTGTGNNPGTTELTPNPANTLATTLSPLVSFITNKLLVYDMQTEAERFWSVQQFIAGQTLRIEFPDDFSDDYYLMSIQGAPNSGDDPLYNVYSENWFLGGYKFKPNLNNSPEHPIIEGSPLAGRVVEIPRGTPFLLARSEWLTWRQNEFGVAGLVFGFSYMAETRWDYSLTVTVNGADLSEGDMLLLRDNLPEHTLIELAKIYAYLTGTCLYYDGDLQFDDLFFIAWQQIDISDKLISIGKVSRTFSDYAQRNTVSFESGDDVPQAQRVVATYEIDNENLEKTKELARLPYSEGVEDVQDGMIVARFDAEENYGDTLYADGIMVADKIAPNGSIYGERVTLSKNAGLQSLCDASTQVEVQARMNAYEYDRITPKTRILCRGTEYVWTSRSWQKDTAKFVLAKLPILSWGDLLVDMGLPSGTKWCAVDIDVTKKHGFAETPFTYEKSFFSWGNIDGHNPTSNTSFAPWNWGGINSQAPWYQGQVYGNTPGDTLNGNISTTPEYDAANKNLPGGKWKIPTREQYQELIDNCIFVDAAGNEITGVNKVITVNGITGIYLQSRINGNRLFFSAGGFGNGTSLSGYGIVLRYWTASYVDAKSSVRLAVTSSFIGFIDTDKNQGLAVRAVM